mmetsp:Transcript_38407/g.78363  ORF Transcript_38407/g.78363 Transcript_38407/m.78363 type:complete len:92 (+) Transcript_38407:633-908(+)
MMLHESSGEASSVRRKCLAQPTKTYAQTILIEAQIICKSSGSSKLGLSMSQKQRSHEYDIRSAKENSRNCHELQTTDGTTYQINNVVIKGK